MPRVRLAADKYRREDMCRCIKGRLGRMGMKQGELADELGVSQSLMSVLVKNPDKMQADRLRKVIQTLQIPLEDTLAFLGYGKKEIRLYLKMVEREKNISEEESL